MKQMTPRLLAWRLQSRALRMALFFLVLLGGVACSANQVDKNRTEVLKQYETLVRWSQWDGAVAFIAPEYLEQHPISRLDMDRLRLFRVTQYTLRSASLIDDGMTLLQTVEIKLFNNNQALERTIIDKQEWRYDRRAKSWRLYSGLPDPTQR